MPCMLGDFPRKSRKPVLQLGQNGLAIFKGHCSVLILADARVPSATGMVEPDCARHSACSRRLQCRKNQNSDTIFGSTPPSEE